MYCYVLSLSVICVFFFFFKQKTAYEMRISDWSSDVCSSDLTRIRVQEQGSGPPVPYMERTRIYYRALGYTNDYVWAYHADVPFARPVKPIGAMKVALISTAGPGDRSHRDERNRRHAWSGLVTSPPETFDTDMAWDKEETR